MPIKKVSVIIPCYNHGLLIDETVDSILDSTYPNIEIIIVNDGSTDQFTNDKLNSYNKPFTKVITTENQGTGGACKVAAEHTTGDYILCMGSDDKIHRTYIEKAVQVLETHPEVGIVYCNAEFFGTKSGPWVLPPYSLEGIKRGNCIFCAALYRKSDYNKTEGYHVDMRNWEDYDLWLSLLELGVGVYKIPEVLFYYRITGTSKTDTVRSDPNRGVRLMQQIYAHHKQFLQPTSAPIVNQPTPRVIHSEKYF